VCSLRHVHVKYQSYTTPVLSIHSRLRVSALIVSNIEVIMNADYCISLNIVFKRPNEASS